MQPPNSTGFTLLQELKIVENFDLSGFAVDSVEVQHIQIEAMKLAFADAYRYVSDPRTMTVSAAQLLDRSYLASRASLIDRHKAQDFKYGTPPTAGTVYLTAADERGMMVSLIQSNYMGFGSGVVVPGTGISMQNRGTGFSLEAGHPNLVGGGKRPYHTIIPGFMERGDAHIGFGIMGGPNQPLAHAQFVSNIVDYGLNLQQALETPRFTKFNPVGNDVLIESRVPGTVLQELKEMGHEVAVKREYTQEMGRGQAILHDSATGTNYAASDPRADGAAIPEPILPS